MKTTKEGLLTNNLYIWFDSQESRRKFILKMFEIRPHIPKSIIIRTEDEAIRRKESIDHLLDMLDRGKYSSPYLRLKETFVDSTFNQDYPDSLDPWHPRLLYTKGFRRVYTLRSYFFRHGYWLVVQLADNKEGRLRYKWIRKNIPESQLGLNVPITLYPCLSIIVLIEKHINEWLTTNSLPINHGVMLESLVKAKNLHPELFNAERIYLWEQLAKIYENRDELESARTCYLAQAELRPHDSGPYLNLGVMYSKRQMVQAAIESYTVGLRRYPQDEYIYHNLASLLEACGEHQLALKMLNSAILANPSRGINHRLKGDILAAMGHQSAAITSYNQALEHFDDEWSTSAANTCLRLSNIYLSMGDRSSAIAALEQGLGLDTANSEILNQLAFLSLANEDWDRASAYAIKILNITPGCTDAYQVLSESLKHLDNHDQANWYRRKWLQTN